MAKALWQYLRAERRKPDKLVFYAERGHKAKEALTRNGLGRLVRRLGAAAGVKAVRCSPHSLRHTNLQMTQKYVVIAEADVEAQSKLYSSMDKRSLRS